MKSVTSGLNYVLLGDRYKPVIVFLHGFMGSLADFKEVGNLLNQDFCCLLIDLPGHGKTEVESDLDYRMERVAIAIIDLLKQLAIGECFLVGYSMGGRLALYLAVYFPQYFPRVVLESASPGLETESERENRIKQDLKVVNRLKSQNLNLFLQQWYTNPLFSTFVKHPNYQKAIARRLNNDPEQLVKSLKYMGLGVQPSLWSQLKSIKSEILLIVGELDSKFTSINQRISLLSPQFKLETVKQASHNTHFELPFEFAHLIQAFLQ